MLPSSAIPAVTVRAVLQGLDRAGVDAAAVARSAGLPDGLAGADALAPDAVVAGRAFGRVWALAAEADPRPELPVLVGRAVPPGALGLLDHAVLSAGTVGEALGALAELFQLASGAVRVVPDAAAGWVWIERERPSPVGDVSDPFTLALTAARLGARAVELVEVDLARPSAAPRVVDGFAAAFGCPVRLGRPRSGLRLYPEAWDRPLPLADPALHSTLVVVAGGVEVRRDFDGPVSDAVARTFPTALPEGRTSIEDAAGAVALSVRTLQRRLAAEGTTFGALLDEFRRGEAARLVGDGAATVGEAARRLGYAEPASFTRAFRRWHGVAPSAWGRGAG